MPDTLHLVLILLAAAVVVVVACRLVRLPPIVGYLAVGIALGPHALAWVPNDSDTRYLGEIGIDGGVLAFTFGVSVLTGIVFGVAPAVRAAKVDLNTSLKAASRD